MNVTLPDGRLYLGGEWRNGTGAAQTSVFPGDSSVNMRFAGASAADVEAAIAAAGAAQAKAAWRNMRPHERATILHEISAGIAKNADRIAQIQTRDTGKTLKETKALAMSAAGTFRFFAAALETLEETITPTRGDCLTFSVHEPLGVISAITPWNSPIASDAQKVAPALAAGNAVVLKPSSWSPMVCLELARIIDESALPKGLFSVVPGAGSDIGDLIVSHPLIKKVSFTGGDNVGRRIARLAVDKMMPVSLELGGKSPTIVFDDCDVDQTIAGILYGVFSSTGQSCIAGSRLFVQRSIYKGFVDRLVAATKALKIGSPYDAATQVAPLVREAHRTEVEGHVARAREDGGLVLTGGERPAGDAYASGSYYAPTIVTGLSNASRLARDEVFGPVLLVSPFDDEEQLVQDANDSVYGLAAGIWTKDFNRAWALARRLETGTVWINTYKQFSISTPFGGLKMSGVGREKGYQGMRAYMAQKSIYWDTSGSPIPWANIGAH